jgi:hypothetical protein
MVMNERAHPSVPKFWLHVPLQATSGEWLTPSADGRMTVLGYLCRLCALPLPSVPANMAGSPIAVQQYLLFDPLPETEARDLLDDLVRRMPVLAFREQVSFEIPHGWIEERESHGSHNLTAPALIASHLQPMPMAGYAYSSSHREAADFLEAKLGACPVISDERVRAAIDLANACRRDTLPRSIFLSWLTIIDSLATRKDRPADICNWLDERIAEAKAKNDDSLLSALGSLKRESHGAAIKNLIERACLAVGENEGDVKARQLSAGHLYGVRSGLSHSGNKTLDPNDVGDAQILARFVLNAAIQHVHILNE